jgi:hypothetical protein
MMSISVVFIFGFYSLAQIVYSDLWHPSWTLH